MAETIVIAGAVAQRPGVGGHTWVFLQYLLGFRRLGFDVLLLDQLRSDVCADAGGRPTPPARSRNLAYVRDVVARFDLEDSFSLLGDEGEPIAGLSRQAVTERVKRAPLLLNVNGFFSDAGILTHAQRRVFLDIDPGFGQMWQELGLVRMFHGHDDHVTIGENIGSAGCAIPTCGLQWVTTPQPVVLDYWKPVPLRGDGYFTSVVSWRGPYGPVDYKGQRYGLRVHEFRKFLALPRLSGRQFQLALDIHPDETADLKSLVDNGWNLIDPSSVAGDPVTYQRYIAGSKAEFAVAKNMYVQTNSGWLSDRSICYLASGKPVLAQDTGLPERYKTGAGLLTFRTLDEARAGVDAICGDYERHARAARAVAEEFFDSDKILTLLLRRLGVR